MTTSSELARVSLLKQIFQGNAPGVRVGIGDDAAVLEAPSSIASGAGIALVGSLVWTVDAQVDGTHFRPEWLSWTDVGRRSFMAAASDLAAMGAEPVAALSALVLGPRVGDEELEELARGQAAAAAEIRAPVAGGNLARGDQTSVTTTLIGRATSPVLRSGAKPGDALWLAGSVGLAAAGLAMLSEAITPEMVEEMNRQDAWTATTRTLDARMNDARMRRCIAAWRRPVARIAEGRTMAGFARAAIDVSDGLSQDAFQLALASDVRLVLDAKALLDVGGEALAVAASLLKRDPLDFALHGGEDYALLAASSHALPGFTRIGMVEAYDGSDRLRMFSDGRAIAVEPQGFDHFRE